MSAERLISKEIFMEFICEKKFLRKNYLNFAFILEFFRDAFNLPY